MATEPVSTAPLWSLSFEEATIVNLDATLSIPVTYDPEREHSVLIVTANLSESDDRTGLRFKYGSSEFNVPTFDGEQGLVENDGEPPQSITFRALLRPANSWQLHGVRLGIEVDEGAQAERLVFGKDMTALITSHGDTPDAGVS
jgi:hypothetical protein